MEIKEQSLPELDDTFAKSFGAESIAKLREGVETDLKNELEYSQKQSVRNQCVQRLLDAVTCDLPETIVNQATRAAVHNIVQSNHNRGVSKDVIEENKDDIYNNAKANAEIRVKANYILAQIAEKEDIIVSEQELSRQVAAMAMQKKSSRKKWPISSRKTAASTRCRKKSSTPRSSTCSRKKPTLPRSIPYRILINLPLLRSKIVVMKTEAVAINSSPYI